MNRGDAILVINTPTNPSNLNMNLINYMVILFFYIHLITWSVARHTEVPVARLEKALGLLNNNKKSAPLSSGVIYGTVNVH